MTSEVPNQELGIASVRIHIRCPVGEGDATQLFSLPLVSIVNAELHAASGPIAARRALERFNMRHLIDLPRAEQTSIEDVVVLVYEANFKPMLTQLLNIDNGENGPFHI